MTMVRKLWLTISAVAVLLISSFYFISLYSYEKLYVKSVEERLNKEGKKLVAFYKIDDVPSFEKRVADYDAVTEADVLFVSNPRDLGACLPYEIHYQSIVNGADREQLLAGEVITKSGYEPRFQKTIMGTVIPILREKKLVGILYMYIPLKGIKDLIFELGFFLAPLSFLLMVATAWLGRKIVLTLTKPLRQMERVADKMSKGDFTERIAFERRDEIGSLAQAFNRMSQALQKEDMRRKDFLANVSHELRTPLSYMKGYSEAMIDGIIKEGEHNKYLRLMQRETDRMQRLVRDLLDLAQLEGDLFPLRKQPTVLAQLIEEELQIYETECAKRQLFLRQDLNPDIITYVDEDRMRQVLHNILDNAMRYTKIGGITVALHARETMCYLEITDTGIGISTAHVTQLGERFYRVDQARSRENGGTGLGLAIVKQIVEVHEGTLQINSKEGVGTTIVIALPMFS